MNDEQAAMWGFCGNEKCPLCNPSDADEALLKEWAKEVKSAAEEFGEAFIEWGDWPDNPFEGKYAVNELKPPKSITKEDLEEAMEELANSGYKPSGSAPWAAPGYKKVRKLNNRVPNAFSNEPEHKRKCPLADDDCHSMEARRPWPIADIIIHLNDNHEWSRNKIADWLETLDVDLSLEPPEGGEG